jgi:hypothetical protein
MSAELVYKKALEQLAEAGNADAKFALALGQPLQVPSYVDVVSAVCKCLKSAHKELGDAIALNENEWCHSTDEAIERARADITEALSILATR